MTAPMNPKPRVVLATNTYSTWTLEWNDTKPEIELRKKSPLGFFLGGDDAVIIREDNYFQDVRKIVWLPPTHGDAFLVAAGSYISVWQLSENNNEADAMDSDDSSNERFVLRCLIPELGKTILDVSLSPTDLDGYLQLAVCAVDDKIRIYNCLDQFDLKIWDLEEEIWCDECRSVCWSPLKTEPLIAVGLGIDENSLIKIYTKDAALWREIDVTDWGAVNPGKRIGDVTSVDFSCDTSRDCLVLALVEMGSTVPLLVKVERPSSSLKDSDYYGDTIPIDQGGEAKLQKDHPLAGSGRTILPSEINKVEWDPSGATLATSGSDVRLWRHVDINERLESFTCTYIHAHECQLV
eukprot:CFRG5286T1